MNDQVIGDKFKERGMSFMTKENEEASNVTLLPVINRVTYEVSDTKWAEFTAEIERVRSLIASGEELEPKDVAKAQTLANDVRNYAVIYRRDITNKATEYKNKLENELARLGYTEITDYVAQKRATQQQEINQRLNQKLTHFNSFVTSELNSTQHLRVSPIASYVANNLASRFPKLNSGAANREISDWSPIETVIHMTILTVENLFIQNPILDKLPASSKSLRAVSDYIGSGDSSKIENLRDILEQDTPILQRMVLKPRVATVDSTVNELSNVLNSDVDNKTKLARIQLLLDVYNNK